MYETPYGDTLAARVLSATGLELVQILYDAAIEAVEAARRHLAEGNIAERSRKITHAVEILTELSQSLDHTKGGELSARLADLYNYIQQVLLDANARQQDDGMREAEGLLKTVREAWAQVAAQPGAAAPVEAPRVPEVSSPSFPWSAPSSEPVSSLHGWSA
jgi:flagellar secretion chaperone FliS